MTYRTFSLIPSLNNNLISDRFTQIDNLFSRLTGEAPISNVTSYNILKKNKETYEITIEVPGYTKEELNILVLSNKLTIHGKPKIEEQKNLEEKNEMTWLHKGIKKNEFHLSFNLEHMITINKANLNNGLLTLQFTYNIPEKEKPKKINIQIKTNENKILEKNTNNA